jgi:nucleotide-binding universal stress UspA family protein
MRIGLERSDTMQRILLAYDGGEPAQKALAMAADLAKKFDATLTVVSVVPVHPGRSPIDPWDDREIHQQELLEAAKALRELGIEPELVESAGDPAKTIERIAAERAVDAVIVGARGLGVVGRVLQGSVSEHVATHAATTVIVAR